MKQRWRRPVSLALAWVLALSLSTGAWAAVSDERLADAGTDTAAYMYRTVKDPQVGSIGGEWAVLGLARSGYEVPEEYYQKYYATVESYVKACDGVLHDKKYTEYSRLIVALSSIGKDARDVAGYDLTKPLGDYGKTIWQGLNGPIWALIALDSKDYPMPENPEAATQATRQMYIDRILDCQLPDGGWSLFGGTAAASSGDGVSDPDITGMALQALAKYQDQAAVAKATEEALACMSKQQDAADGSGSNQMASEQAFYGLIAAQRARDGRNSLYRMGDSLTVTGELAGAKPGEGLEGKDPAVTYMPIVDREATFPDITGVNAHKNQPAIESLASRGVISGKSGGNFDPDGDMTRAEFAAIVVKALGLTPAAADRFTDVPADAWYAGYVGTASTYGIVTGTGDGSTFRPDGTISRQEAAVMVARAAKLCGMDTALDTGAIRDILAQFTDYVTTSEWAREGLAFCYQEDILDQSALEIRPTAAIKRCEIAQMLFNLLGSANLL